MFQPGPEHAQAHVHARLHPRGHTVAQGRRSNETGEVWVGRGLRDTSKTANADICPEQKKKKKKKLNLILNR